MDVKPKPIKQREKIRCPTCGIESVNPFFHDEEIAGDEPFLRIREEWLLDPIQGYIAWQIELCLKCGVKFQLPVRFATQQEGIYLQNYRKKMS